MSGIVGWTNWIGVVSEDVARQRAFYRDVLGLKEIHAGPDFVWFDLGWPVMLEVLAMDRAQPQYDGRRFQTGFSTGDINATPLRRNTASPRPRGARARAIQSTTGSGRHRRDRPGENGPVQRSGGTIRRHL